MSTAEVAPKTPPARQAPHDESCPEFLLTPVLAKRFLYDCDPFDTEVTDIETHVLSFPIFADNEEHAGSYLSIDVDDDDEDVLSVRPRVSESHLTPRFLSARSSTYAYSARDGGFKFVNAADLEDILFKPSIQQEENLDEDDEDYDIIKMVIHPSLIKVPDKTKCLSKFLEGEKRAKIMHGLEHSLHSDSTTTKFCPSLDDSTHSSASINNYVRNFRIERCSR